jgi:hypothetical protein
MEEPPVMGTGPEPQPVREEPPSPAFSLLGRMVNVFGVPGQVFEDLLRCRPHPGHWLLPALLGFWVGFVGTWWVWGMPAMRQFWMTRYRAAVEARVAAGSLDADRAGERVTRMERMLASPFFRVAVALDGGLQGGLRFLVWAGVGWGLGRWVWRRPVSWVRCCEVSGLASLIGLLGDVVTLLMMVPGDGLTDSVVGGPGTPGSEIQRWGWVQGFVQSLLGFWHLAVLGVGLSKLLGVDWIRVLWWLIGLRLLGSLLTLLATGWV